jgi:hypothetical protein
MTCNLVCECCNRNQALGVASSAFGPLSHAYCRTCLEMPAEVKGTLIASWLCETRPLEMIRNTYFWDKEFEMYVLFGDHLEAYKEYYRQEMAKLWENTNDVQVDFDEENNLELPE